MSPSARCRSAALFFGLKAAVLAVVVEAVRRIGKRALKTRFLVVLAAWWLGSAHTIARKGVFFSQAAVVTFSGAYAVLAYVAQRAVEDFAWLRPGEMIDGLALAETTPGPLIIVLQFVGFVAAYRQPGLLYPLMAAVLGAALTTWVRLRATSTHCRHATVPARSRERSISIRCIRMTPEQRKSAAEATIRSLDLPVNEDLRLLVADDEVQLRSPEEVLQRMIALWSVVGAAMIPGNRYFHRYIVANRYQPWLSARESRFLLKENPGEQQRIQYSWQLEPLYFIGWCAGVIEHIGIAQGPSSLKDIVGLFPKDMAPPERLKAAIRLRPTAEIMDQIDLVYRLDWGVRNLPPTADDCAPVLNASVIQEWHRAANWMIRHKGQDDWDHIEIGA